MYGPSDGGYRAPQPQRSSGVRPALWMLSALIVVVAAGVTIAVVLSGGQNSPESQGSTSPRPQTTSLSSGSTSPTSAPAGGAPTTDVLPSNPQSATCASTVTPNLVVVALVTYLGLVKNGQPDSNTRTVITDCVSAAVRGELSKVYGVQFGIDYSADLTGGSDKGATARYSVSNAAGTATLTLTLTRQQDQHYEVTGITYA